MRGGEPRERAQMCRRCAIDTREAELDRNGVCSACLRAGVRPVMPLVTQGDWERYDVSRIFAGLRTYKVRQGDGPEYQMEARSPCGCFYAAGEACVAFETKAGKTTTANILLREFPRARRFVSGDDGVNVLHVPAAIFPAVAARVGAYRKRVLSPERKAALVLQAARARACSPICRKVPAA